MQLEPCAQCKRHVAIDEIACPFCAAPIDPSARRPALVGRWSRAAIFAGATTLGACHPSQSPTTTQQLQNDTQHSETNTEVKKTEVPPPAPGTGTIHGVLRDQNGALMANMPIRLTQGGYTQTDANGEFVFSDLPPGTYGVLFQEPDRPNSNMNMTNVAVTAGAVTQADGTFEPIPVDTGPCCKPYGAPPARRRVV